MSCEESGPRASGVGGSIASAVVLVVVAGCVHSHAPVGPVRAAPSATIAVGACAEPGHDGVIGPRPRLDRADRDLDGDGRPEAVVVDRALCTPQGNCYWNVFEPPVRAGDCARYLGTFEGAALETLATSGEDHMRDVRAYWQQSGGRILLESYRYERGGYRTDDVLQCKRQADDRLECAESGR